MSGLGNLVHSIAKVAAVAALAGGICSFGFAAPARAQLFGWYGYQPFEYREDLSAGEVRGVLQRQGYRLTGPLMRNGRVLLADVVDPRGRSLRLIVDPGEGRILQRFVNADPRTQPRDRNDDRERSAPTRPDYSEQPQQRGEPAARPRRTTPKARVVTRKPAAKSNAAQAPQEPVESRSPPQANAAPQQPATAPPTVAAAPVAPRAAPPADAAAPRASRSQPGYVNGVPINPLD